MFGVVLSLLYAGWLALTGAQFGDIWLNATDFLHTWYIWTSVIMGVLVLIGMGLITLGGIGAGSDHGPFGLLVGFVGGGALSLFAGLMFVIYRGALIWGSLLMYQAYNGGVWDNIKLIFGVALMALGLILGRSSSSSSSSSSRN